MILFCAEKNFWCFSPKMTASLPGVGKRLTCHHLGIKWCLSFRKALPKGASDEHHPSAQMWGLVFSTMARYGESALKIPFILEQKEENPSFGPTAWTWSVLLPSVPPKGIEGLFSCRLQPWDEARGACCLSGDDDGAVHSSARHSHHFCRWVSRFSSRGECPWDTLGCCTCARSTSMLPGKPQPDPICCPL